MERRVRVPNPDDLTTREILAWYAILLTPLVAVAAYLLL